MPKVYRKQLSTIEMIPNSYSMESNLFMMNEKIMDSDFAFYQVNLGSVVQQFSRWKNLLPRIQPFFAVKCQPDSKVISLLGKLGAGFDCSSKEELKLVAETMKFNTIEASKNIIYANTFKFKKDIIYASRTGVTLATFDNESELVKLSKDWPSAQLVLLLSPPRSYAAKSDLGNKFGVDPEDVSTLLYRAKELSMDVVGFRLSFHIGSECNEMDAFPETVIYCSKVMELARKIGFNPYLLDIGGGFPGLSSVINDIDKQLEFEEMCSKLNLVLDAYFPEEDNYKIIAEPGRYFVMGAYTLATEIIDKSSFDICNHNQDKTIVVCNNLEVNDDHCYDLSHNSCSSSYNINCDELFENSREMDQVSLSCEKSSKETINEKGYRYVINDGVYNSFNCIVFDHAKPFPYGIFDEEGYFHEIGTQSPFFLSTVYGSTRDDFDCVLQPVKLPQMEIGNWIVWPNMGEYTITPSNCLNNGVEVVKRYYFMCETDIIEMEKMCSRALFESQVKEISCSEMMLFPAQA